MSVIRGFGAGVSRSLLIFFIISSIITAGIAELTSEEFTTAAVESTIDQYLSDLDVEVGEILQELKQQCQIKPGDNASLPITELNLNLDFSCDELSTQNLEGFKQSVKNQIVDKAISINYRKEVCEGFGCVQKIQSTQDPIELISIIVSEDFNSFLNSLSFLAIILAVIFGVVVVVLSEGIGERFIGLGYPLVIAGLPYIGMTFLRNRLYEQLPSRLVGTVNELVSTLSTKFLWVLVGGIVLLVIGLLLKFVFKIGKFAIKSGSQKKSKKK